ncbi:cytokine receptor common subunit gamma [Discoglossus pictus]
MYKSSKNTICVIFAVKLDPPYSLKINSTDNNELLLKWQQDSGLFPIHCMCFQVQHHNMASEQWRLKDVNSAQFSLPSFDPQQSYTFQVRSKLNNLCATTEMWSEWSEDITWGKTETMSVEPSRSAYVQSLIMYLMLPFVCLVLVLLVLTRVERIWVIFVPRIPNPGKKFEDLFKTYKGDFQEWLGISKEVVESLKHNYTEPLCSVSEDP